MVPLCSLRLFTDLPALHFCTSQPLPLSASAFLHVSASAFLSLCLSQPVYFTFDLTGQNEQ